MATGDNANFLEYNKFAVNFTIILFIVSFAVDNIYTIRSVRSQLNSVDCVQYSVNSLHIYHILNTISPADLFPSVGGTRNAQIVRKTVA